MVGITAVGWIESNTLYEYIKLNTVDILARYQSRTNIYQIYVTQYRWGKIWVMLDVWDMVLHWWEWHVRLVNVIARLTFTMCHVRATTCQMLAHLLSISRWQRTYCERNVINRFRLPADISVFSVRQAYNTSFHYTHKLNISSGI